MKARKSLIGMCLAVLGLPGVAAAGSASGRVLLVLDSSGSMQEQIDGRQRMDLATEAMREFLGNLDRLDLEIAFMAYGHRRSDDCGDIELLVPPSLGRASEIRSRLDSLKPLGKTPLAAAITAGGQTLLEAGDVPLRMVVLTDGLETCGGDPAAAARALAAQGVDVAVHIVGFAVSADERAVLEAIAKAGRGNYYDADNAQSLAESFKKVEEVIVEQVETSQVIFQDTFDRDQLGENWRVIAEDPDRWVLDDGAVLLLSAEATSPGDEGNSETVYPNTIELTRELPENYLIEVDMKIHFNPPTPAGSLPYPRVWQTVNVQLFQDGTHNIGAAYYLGTLWANARRCYQSVPAFGQSAGRGQDGAVQTIWKDGPALVFKDDPRPEHEIALRFLIEKRRYEYKAFVQRAGDEVTDKAPVELGSFHMLRLKPRLQINAGNMTKGWPSAEVRIEKVTIREL